MSTREDTREKPLDPPMLPHETRKDNIAGQTLKEHFAGKPLDGTLEHESYRVEDSAISGESVAHEEANLRQSTGANLPTE